MGVIDGDGWWSLGRLGGDDGESSGRALGREPLSPTPDTPTLPPLPPLLFNANAGLPNSRCDPVSDCTKELPSGARSSAGGVSYNVTDSSVVSSSF